jgi:biopolymer transport protein ExbD
MFFLLASFMMVSLSQVHMKGMKVNLPTGISGQTQNKREYVSLSVDKDGQIYFDKTPMEPDQVYKTMQEIHRTSPNAKIFIRGDRDAYHGDIIRLIEQVRSSGFYKIAFEIKSPSLPQNMGNH